MHKFYQTVILFILSLAISLPASAVESVAIVDIQRIVQESLAAKDIQKQIEAKRTAYQKEIDAREDTLRNTDKELSEQRNILAPDAFEQKVKDFRTEVAETQRDVQAKKVQLDRAFANAMTEVQKVVVEIVSELSKKDGFSIAIPASQVLYYKDKYDISSQILEQLNKRLPSVQVQLNEKQS